MTADPVRDQIDAAYGHTSAVHEKVAELLGQRRSEALVLGPFLATIVERLPKRMNAGLARVCQHLAGGPQPAFGLLSDPYTLRCAQCAVKLLRTVATEEWQHTCDVCGERVEKMWSSVLQVEFITYQYGVCGPCRPQLFSNWTDEAQ